MTVRFKNIEAGALIRKDFRNICNNLNLEFNENKGFLSSTFIVWGKAEDMFRLLQIMHPSLRFKPHPTVQGMEQAKLGNYSIIRGRFVSPGYEVMDPQGEVHQHLNLTQVMELITDGVL